VNADLELVHAAGRKDAGQKVLKRSSSETKSSLVFKRNLTRSDCGDTVVTLLRTPYITIKLWLRLGVLGLGLGKGRQDTCYSAANATRGPDVSPGWHPTVGGLILPRNGYKP
jgi:hypothetical protein